MTEFLKVVLDEYANMGKDAINEMKEMSKEGKYVFGTIQVDGTPNIDNVEDLDILYYRVFNRETEQEKFRHNNIEYTIRYEHGTRYPKFFFGNGVLENYILTNMRKIIKGEELTHKNPPKARKYWVS